MTNSMKRKDSLLIEPSPPKQQKMPLNIKAEEEDESEDEKK